jgi:hypothetical protein
MSKENNSWNWSDHVGVGDVILIQIGEHRTLGVSEGEYVVEDAQQRGGWTVTARQLTSKGEYISTNPLIQFRQCSGYTNSILGSFILVTRRMKRVFI